MKKSLKKENGHPYDFCSLSPKKGEGLFQTFAMWCTQLSCASLTFNIDKWPFIPHFIKLAGVSIEKTCLVGSIYSRPAHPTWPNALGKVLKLHHHSLGNTHLSPFTFSSPFSLDSHSHPRVTNIAPTQSLCCYVSVWPSFRHTTLTSVGQSAESQFCSHLSTNSFDKKKFDWIPLFLFQETKDDVDQHREENGAVTTEIPRSRKIKWINDRLIDRSID